MKKIIFLITVLSLFNCNNYEEINLDSNVAYTTIASTTLSYAQKELSDYMNTPNVNINNFRLTMQYWQEVTYVNESIYDFVNRNVANSIFSRNYTRVLSNLKQTKKLTEIYEPTPVEINSWPTTKKNQLAIADLLMVYTFQNLVDTFGDIPYSEALNIENTLPKYDSALDIYTDLINRCKQDIADLSTDPSFVSGDYFYKGDIAKWKKFGNSLLLKLGIAIADVDSGLAQSTVNAAILGGVFTSSNDDCKLQYLDASPNYNPLYENLVASERDDFQAAAPIVDYMNEKNDPRRPFYFKKVNDVYLGSPVGQPSEFGDFSAIGSFAYTTTTPGVILNYTEVAFYLTEAAARWTPASASTAYETAVKASLSEWGVAESDATTYLADNPFDEGNWKKSIGEQAWVAMFNQGITSWNFYRRLDFPVLSAPSNAISQAEGKVPVRITYPVKETTTNPTNYAAASAAIGGDKLTTKIFWDVN